MKKKAFLCMLAACLTLGMAGCGAAGKDTAGNSGAASQADGTAEGGAAAAEKDSAAGSTSDGNTRLVSVEDAADYLTLGDYKGIVLQKTETSVTDEDVESEISENLKKNMEIVSAKSATVQAGDSVTISYVGRLDGTAFDGGTGDTQDLVIGSGTMIPGFEDGIIGMKTGETKNVEAVFPDDYSAADLAGKTAVFEITLQSFKRAPELTEEWVTENTDYASLDEYREGIRAELTAQAETEAENDLRTEAWTTVFGDSEVTEYPQADIDNAAASYKSQIEAYAQQAGMTLEEYVQSQGISTEDFEAQCTQYARQKVKQNLIIQAIMDAEGLTLEDEESLAIQEQLISDYGTDLATLVDTYGQEAVDETIGLLRVEDFIVANANIEQGSAETATETSAGTTAETAAGVSAETTAETAAGVSAETTAETAAEASAGTAAETAAEVSTEITTEAAVASS